MHCRILQRAMRYHVLVTDYDETIATHGFVEPRTIASLESVKDSGRRLVLVTGRELEDLFRIFPRLDLFDRVVAENGGVLYNPATREQRLLADPPSSEFIAALRETAIHPLSIGKVIVATRRPNESRILGIIRDLGLELHVIFNRTAVMVLPSSVNKASGLQAALLELGLSPHNCVAVGDAENDHAFLSIAECSVAVANALDSLKKRVDYVLHADTGAGVAELIQSLLESDLRFLDPTLRHRFVLGTRSDGRELSVGPYGSCILIAGTSGGGKSTMANAFIEKLIALDYQFCIIDPEGDYLNVEGAVALGDNQGPPTAAEVIELLGKSSQNVIVNLVGVPLKERPTLFESLLHRIQELSDASGRPHWLIVDETHHVLPSGWKVPGPTVPKRGLGVLMITVDPDKLPPAALELPDLVIAIGDDPDRTLHLFSDGVGHSYPALNPVTLNPGEGVAWFWKDGEPPFRFRSHPPKGERQRHQRKYAEGELPPELSFYFRGPDKKLNLRAQNLSVFVQLADGVDDATWLFHLKEKDVSRWFREVIKDPELAAAAEPIENGNLTAKESRALIVAEIQRRYIAS